MKALLISADGSTSSLVPANGTHFTLKEAQQSVGGYVELLSLSPGERIMLFNEEGLMRQLPANAKASVIARRPIVGNVMT